mmetsp:Transcript_67334/g.146763  ORF Transcript_67334/g.146763 Transcript_67334/m.146763 type:complete len:219 (+) Transcript_67334:117-773(+)
MHAPKHLEAWHHIMPTPMVRGSGGSGGSGSHRSFLARIPCCLMPGVHPTGPPDGPSLPLSVTLLLSLPLRDAPRALGHASFLALRELLQVRHAVGRGFTPGLFEDLEPVSFIVCKIVDSIASETSGVQNTATIVHPLSAVAARRPLLLHPHLARQISLDKWLIPALTLRELHSTVLTLVVRMDRVKDKEGLYPGAAVLAAGIEIDVLNWVKGERKAQI